MRSGETSDLTAPRAEVTDEQRELAARLLDHERTTSAFIATASHELRTPLANILGYVELLQDLEAGPLEAEQVQMLGVVERNAKRLLSLVENMLTVSNAGNGTFVIDQTPVDVAALVTRVQQQIEPKVAEAVLRLNVSVDPQIAPLHGDAVQLERALLNIVANALKFTPPSGRIDIRVAELDDGTVRFEVSDTGVGMPARECDNLFQPFFKSSTSHRDETQGMGLGLHIVKLIVEGHGGQVGATSFPDDGTTVWFTVPNAFAPRGRQ